MFGVSTVVSPPGTTPDLSRDVFYSGPDLMLSTVRQATGRVQCLSDWIVETNSIKRLQSLQADDFDSTKQIILGVNLKGLEDVSDASRAQARIVHDGTDRVVVETTSRNAFVLLLRDTHYPGWESLIDGQLTEIADANHAFRAVVVPSGAHQVEFRFNPGSYRLGLQLAAISACFLLGFAIFQRRANQISPTEGQPAHSS